MAITRLGGANAITGTIPTSVAPGQGKILQFKSTSFNTTTSSTSSTYSNISDASLSITPSSTSSKIYFSCYLSGCRKNDGDTYMGIKLFRQINGGGYSEIEKMENGFLYTQNANTITTQGSYAYLDSPSSTNQVDYKLQLNSGANTGRVRVNVDAQESSQVTLMEVST
jgi:hypothetical protein